MSIEYFGNARLLMKQEGLSESDINAIVTNQIGAGQNASPAGHGTAVADGVIRGNTVRVVYSQDPSDIRGNPNVDAVVISTMVLE